MYSLECLRQDHTVIFRTTNDDLISDGLAGMLVHNVYTGDLVEMERLVTIVQQSEVIGKTNRNGESEGSERVAPVI
jgi:hypothetical protein